jgi:hypothetical protein
VGESVIVTIDRDNQNDFTDLLFELRLRYLCKDQSNCRVWKTNKGYHVALRINGLDFEKALFLRAYLLDDFYRLGYDLARTDELGPGAMTASYLTLGRGREEQARELEL